MTWNKNLTADQEALADFISECSEEAVCAGWEIGCEYTLWGIMTGELDEYMYLDVTPELRQTLRRLHEACGGWIVWRDDECETFVPLADWKEMYEMRNARLAGHERSAP